MQNPKMEENEIKPLVSTFYNEFSSLTVELLTPPNQNGLCRLKWNDHYFVRHITKITALNEEAKNILK